ncbi:MAG: hypothetical protein SFX73_15020 [Kofleriaceae bacterium]|nr:hypothetical protein [Kofleriaceae bacterium]
MSRVAFSYAVPSFVLLASSLLSAGCPAHDDSEQPPLDFAFVSEADVHMAFNAMDLPYVLAFTSPHAADGRACPAITQRSGGYQVRGGCVDEAGTRYEGTIDVEVAVGSGAPQTVEYDFEFADFSEVGFTGDGTPWSYTLDGRLVGVQRSSECGYPAPDVRVDGPLSITVGGDVRSGYGGWFPGDGGAVSLVIHDYQYGWNGDCDRVGLTGSGTVDVLDRGRFRFELDSLDEKTCRNDPTTGGARFFGADEATITYDGATACDGCIPYVTSGGQAGSFCWQP